MLDFLVSPAHAQAAPQGDPFFSFLPLIVLIVLFYFMLIRPQMKRSREMREMLGKLAKGDEVITSGGLAGVLREIGENYVTLEVADNVQVKLQKSAVISVLPKGSLKAL
ncbi:MAG: preprotein translocase subunit YajC [Gammaproteobacteria bacterium]